MRRILLLALLVFNLHGNTYAQYGVDSYSLKGEAPPQVFSPNAASLGEYGKIPVSYYNGIPNISIPIGEVQGIGGISLPISLSYHGSGNKPDNHPGWVGQGWALHAGGCINRVLNGFKDELDKQEFLYTSNNAKDLDLSERILDSPLPPGYYYQAALVQGTYPPPAIFGTGNVCFPDVDPDEFQINVDGLNASFFFVGDNQIAIKTKQPGTFKVDVNLESQQTFIDLYRFSNSPDRYYKAIRYSCFTGFTITKDDGTIYTFGYDDTAIEYSFALTFRGGQLIATANTWHLTEIKYTNGERIRFQYTHEGLPIIKTDVNSGYSVFKRESSVPYETETREFDTKDDNSWPVLALRDYTKISYSLIRPSYLCSITSEKAGDEVVLFHQKTKELKYCTEDDYLKFRFRLGGDFELMVDNTEGEDYYKCLSSIQIKRRSYHNLFYSEDLNKRLTLESIRINDFNGRRIGSYVMEYNSVRLPDYCSKQTDHWGYYNGKPSYESVNYSDLKSYRTPSINYMKAEILEKITYPTGGYTEFTYEPHSYSRTVTHNLNNVNIAHPGISSTPTDEIAGGLRIKTIKDVVDGKVEERSFEYVNNEGRSSGILSGDIVYNVSGWVAPVQTVYLNDIVDSFFLRSEGHFQIFSEHFPIQLSTTDGNHVTYDRVVERFSDNSRLVYSYYNHNDSPDEPLWGIYTYNVGAFPYGNRFTSCELFRGHLKRKEVFDFHSQLKQKEEYVYDGLAQYSGSRQYIIAYGTNYTCGVFLFEGYGYKQYVSRPLIREKVNVIYPETGTPIQDNYYYEYNQDDILTKISHVRGNNNEETRIRYVGDLRGCTHEDIYAEMIDANMVATPIEVTRLRNGGIVNSQLMTFKKERTNLMKDRFVTTRVPSCLYSMDLDEPRDNSTYLGFDGISVDPLYTLEQEYIQHDTSCNLLTARNRDGSYDLIRWGHEGRYPTMVTKTTSIVNVFYEDFEKRKRSWFESHEYDGNYDGGFNSEKAFVGEFFPGPDCSNIEEAIIDYRVLINGKWYYVRKNYHIGDSINEGPNPIDEVRIYPSCSLVESYTWRPGVGILSKTDCRGYTESYSYDAYTRLTGVYDDSGNQMVKYEYILNNGNENKIVNTVYTERTRASFFQDYSLFDGLGRLKGVINKGASPNGADILSGFTEYDALGRKRKIWLPIAGATPSVEEAGSFYGDNNPFTEYLYDGTPLETVQKVYNPGEAWRNAGRGVKSRLLSSSNLSSGIDHCDAFSISWQGDTSFTLLRKTAELMAISETTEESGLRTLVFKNMFGQTTLKRIIPSDSSTDILDTYYVYDNMGRLSAVLPPLLTCSISSNSDNSWISDQVEELNKFGYFYRYDSRGNVIWKKLPGCAWTKYVYDKGGRLVFSQDGEQRSSGKAWFSLADSRGLKCISGLCTNNLETVQEQISDKNICVYYNKTSGGNLMGYVTPELALDNPSVLSVQYYDGYGFINDISPATFRSRLYDNIKRAWYGVDGQPAGLMTGSAERIIGEDLTNEFRWKSIRYDHEARPYAIFQTRADHGVDVVFTRYNFTGKATEVYMEHNPWAGAKHKEYYRYNYDHRERVTAVEHSLDSLIWTTISNHKYDAVGRLVSDEKNGVLSLKTGYDYNVRSWPTRVYGNGLMESLSYGLDGNISSISWYDGTTVGSYTDNYHYDGISRLIRSDRTNYIDGFFRYRYTDEYSYDKHGNINYAEKRFEYDVIGNSAFVHEHNQGHAAHYSDIVQVSFAHEGNQLTSSIKISSAETSINELEVTDSLSSSYTYDRSGRMIVAGGNGMSEVAYNAIGYPSYINLGNGGYTYNTYAADGTRLESREMSGTGLVTDMAYEGNEVIENGNLRMLLFEGGYIDFSEGTPRYYWYTKDHLGSVRAVSDSSGSIIARYAYGPYGEEFAAKSISFDDTVPVDIVSNPDDEYVIEPSPEISLPFNPEDKLPEQTTNPEAMPIQRPIVTYSATASSAWQPFRFSGKESLTHVGLDLYDFGARMYSPSNMRWLTMDPLAEKYYHISPYAYCSGNPVNLVDPTGCFYGDFYNLNGIYIGSDGKNDDKKYIVLKDEEAKTVKNNTKKGSFTSKSDVSSAIEVPSNEVVDKCDEALKASDVNEHGFVVATDGTTSSMIEGDPKSVVLGPGYEELEAKGKETSHDVHIHPYSLELLGNDKYKGSSSEPSTADKNYRRVKEENGAVNQPSWVIATVPTNVTADGNAGKAIKITIYDSSSPNGIATTDWNRFKRAAKKLNK